MAKTCVKFCVELVYGYKKVPCVAVNYTMGSSDFPGQEIGTSRSEPRALSDKEIKLYPSELLQRLYEQTLKQNDLTEPD